MHACMCKCVYLHILDRGQREMLHVLVSRSLSCFFETGSFSGTRARRESSQFQQPSCFYPSVLVLDAWSRQVNSFYTPNVIWAQVLVPGPQTFSPMVPSLVLTFYPLSWPLITLAQLCGGKSEPSSSFSLSSGWFWCSQIVPLRQFLPPLLPPSLRNFAFHLDNSICLPSSFPVSSHTVIVNSVLPKGNFDFLKTLKSVSLSGEPCWNVEV